MDLGESIGCCKLLVKSVDDQLAKLQCGTNSRLDTESRLRIVFENKVCENFQMYIQRQTNALTLLLTACNWHVTSSTYSEGMTTNPWHF
jgi:guanine nucleotide-binding protein G(i) subunit alpha